MWSGHQSETSMGRSDFMWSCIPVSHTKKIYQDMNNRLKNLLDSPVSLITVLIIFLGLLTTAVFEKVSPTNFEVEIVIGFILGVILLTYLLWATVILATNRYLKPLDAKRKLIYISFICIFFITYIFLTRNLISSCIFSLFPIWVWIGFLKGYKASLE